MEYVIAVFTVRTETLMFNNYLNKIGVSSVVINTPKEAHTSCGICVRFPLFALDTVRRSNIRSYRSFAGLFLYQKTFMGINVSPIKYN